MGLAVDVVTLEFPAVIDRLTRGDYEAIYFGTQASDTDPHRWCSRRRFSSPATPTSRGWLYRYINHQKQRSLRGFSRWISDHPDFRSDLIESAVPEQASRSAHGA